MKSERNFSRDSKFAIDNIEKCRTVTTYFYAWKDVHRKEG